MRKLTAKHYLGIGLFLWALSGLPAWAAKEDGCSGGAFSIITSRGILTGNQNATLSKDSLGAKFTVQGRFIKFDVVSASFGVQNYTFLFSSTNPQPIVAFASKTPLLQGLTLTSDVSVSIKDESLVIQRTGAGISMQIQANDCSTGGLFQMEPERGDGQPTDIVHVLGPDVFYFNNPNFGPPPPPLPLCPAGGPFTPSCTPVPITPRVNFATDFSKTFVGRDSPQSATKIAQTGASSTWRVSSGGRMGGVFGEDSVEVAPPAVPCTSHCQAQDQVRGKFPVLGFPFPVPAADKITPR
ncbi:MAG TPA: hypothetical protein VHW24_00255 [Bryobacteraceae bacterium]|jgi:hypothetical protein|nr:hypothetical protein [Bryobacteraceae bacterium]